MLKHDQVVTDLKFELIDDILAIWKICNIADGFYECPEEKRQSLIMVATYSEHSVHYLEDHYSLIFASLIYHDVLLDHRK
jgi:hypothetical protein